MLLSSSSLLPGHPPITAQQDAGWPQSGEGHSQAYHLWGGAVSTPATGRGGDPLLSDLFLGLLEVLLGANHVILVVKTATS